MEQCLSALLLSRRLPILLQRRPAECSCCYGFGAVKIADGISVASVLQITKAIIAKSLLCFLCQYLTNFRVLVWLMAYGAWFLFTHFRLKVPSRLDALRCGW